MVDQSFARASAQTRVAASRSRSRAAGPRLRAVLVRARNVLDRVTGAGASAVLTRPRFLRGASLEVAVDARPISTARLELRPHRLEDAEAWHALVSDARVIRYLSWPMRDAAAARNHLRDRTRHTRLWQTDDFLAFGVEREGQLIGDVSVQLRSVSNDMRTVELGWVLAPQYQGHGYATEAVAAVIDLAVNSVRARMVTAVIADANDRSLALARRLGFVQVHQSDGTRLMLLTPEHRTRTQRQPLGRS